jgi:AraC-like DNA-binding protein
MPIMANIEWLLREATDERLLRLDQRLVIDDERWRATIERLDLGAGLRVFLTQAMAHREVTVEPRDDRDDQWVGSQVTVDGRARIDFRDGVQTRADTDIALLFRPSQRVAAYTLEAGATFRSAGYGLEVGRIVRLFDGDVPKALQPLLDAPTSASHIVAMRGDRRLRTLAEGLFAPGLNGPLRRLMLEGGVLQLLAAQAAAAGEPRVARGRRALSVRETNAVHEARERLIADMRRPPSLGELALAVGLTEKRLNTGFSLLYGATAFETLRNERLAHARTALEAGAATVKEIAFRVGYNHVTNFVRAYSARYGTPGRRRPGSAGASRRAPVGRPQE